MIDNQVKISELDGKQLYNSFIAGAYRIFENQKLLNKINVFPVPDADTGTNLASTVRSMIDAIIPTNNPKETAIALADAALTGARGNSGIIFAQFLYGFSNEIKTEQALDVRSFAESMKNAVAYAYEAIANPVEGTILTVIRDWADYLYTLKDIIDDFIRLLIKAYEKAQQSLAETTGKLEVLARSHVVDAGAKGFVVFLEGILDFFTNGGIKNTMPSQAIPEQDEMVEEEVSHEEIKFRYCSEALINGQNLNRKKILETIRHTGDSIVIAGSLEKLRIHLHTDYPAELFSILQKFGSITYQKVDDMVFQREIRFNRKASIALFTDSSCDLPREVLDRYQIHVVPLIVHFGETFFLDRVTIQPKQFYSLLDISNHTPSSAQPSYKEFVNRYEFIASHYDSIIGINLSQVLSGTWFNSDKAAREVSERTGKKIRVFNSRSVSAGMGLVILRIARAIEEGVPYDELVPKIEGWIAKSQIRVSIPTLKYIVRSGRVSQFKGFIARLLNLKPVIGLNEEGATYLVSKSFTEKGSMRKVIRNIRTLHRKNSIGTYAITHVNNQKCAEWYTSEMEKICRKSPEFIDNVSPVLAANAGPGAVCISLLFE